MVHGEHGNRFFRASARWWQLTFFVIFTPECFGEDEPIFFRAYFSNGLVKPPTSSCMFYKFLVVF